MTTIKTYRTCFVPLCKNTTKSAPNKVFVTVPQDVKLRKKWFNAAQRDNLKDSKSNFFCCEDHFDLQEDMENYLYYKTMGGPAKIKKNVQPHKFECQPDRKRRTCPSPRVSSEKRQRRMEINELLEEACGFSLTSPFDAIDHTSISTRSDPVAAKDDLVKSSAEDNSTLTAAAKKDVGTQTSVTQRHAAVQAHIRPHYRSVSSMCKIKACTVDECTSPMKLPNVSNIVTSPKKYRPNVSESISTSISSIGIVSSNDYYTPTNRTSSNDSNSPTKTVQDILKVTDYFISTNMKAYLGIPNEWNELLNLLSMKSNISMQNIKLCLMKIRRQDTFERLAEQFCMSPSNASIIFNKTVPILRHFLQTLIFFPNPEVVTKNLPIAFRNSYSHVQSIVDALEIQIEKPSDPVNQALTWSEYKKCNTLKYLISCGPDGFINFISTGFGGRISDVLLFEKSNILDQLPPNVPPTSSERLREEELKRFHAAGYGQVGFNYDAPSEPAPISQPVEVDEPFVPMPAFRTLLPADILLPESQKQNAIIEKTATFIATQGAQMEILIKAKQRDNPQFKFLNRESELHAYYIALIGLVKAGKWPEKKVEVLEVEEQHPENEYLHPSLASAVIESAPSIPSIHYKPSADCDYTLLIYKMRGEATLDEAYVPELAPGEVAPPGTEPLPPRGHAEISRAPVMYHRAIPTDQNTPPASLAAQYQQYAAYYQQYSNVGRTQPTVQPTVSTQPVAPSITVTPSKSTGLSLMKNYNTDSDSDSDTDNTSSSEGKDKPVIPTPPPEVQTVIDKMAAYVARNGDEFAEIVRAKNDPRFTFLEPSNEYYAYYTRLMQKKRGVDLNGKEEVKTNKTPVSFSIKKLKEPEPILPKPALPYESSSDDESEKTDKQTDQQTENQELTESPTTNIPQIVAMNNIPQVVYKMEMSGSNDLPTVKTIETVPKIIGIVPKVVLKREQTEPVVKEKTPPPQEVKPKTEVEVIKEKSPTSDEKRTTEKSRDRYKDSSERMEVDKRKHREEKHHKKEYKSKSENKEVRRVDRSSEGDKKVDKEREKKKKYKDELENEVISLVDNPDDLIDLTGDQSDCKAEVESEAERAKQAERRRRAAEFLRKVGVDPGATPLPTSSLACAMVETLETLQKKKVEEEENRRKRDKRRHRDRRGCEDESERSHPKSKRRKNRTSDDNEESDHESSKKKKRKKDKKHSSKGKKKRRRETEVEEDPLPLNIDLTNTLKVLRTSSPTKELGLQDVEEIQHSQEQSSEESGEHRGKKRKKEEREYSEGEWSSDSEEDSMSSDSKEE